MPSSGAKQPEDGRPASVSPGEFITIARVVKPQGKWARFRPSCLRIFQSALPSVGICLRWVRGERRELELEDFWPHKGRMILKFAGIDSIDDAATLVGAEIQIPREQRAQLEEGSFYVSDLVGCRVFASREPHEVRELGPVTDVVFGAGEAPLLEIREGSAGSC